jgi:excisionase family DNA binding protein
MKQSNTPMSEVTAIEAAHLTGHSERTIRRWIKAGKLPACQLAPNRYAIKVSDLHTGESVEQPSPLALLQAHIEELETRQAIQLDTLTQRINTLEGELTALKGELAALQQHAPASRKAPKSAPEPLPAHYIYWRKFANQHGIAQNDLAAKIQQGFVHQVKGKWTLENGAPITEALDERGQHDAWVQYHSSASFRACDTCPHSQPVVRKNEPC